MSKIKLTGSNSGYVEIDSAADAGNLTLQLPTSGTKLLSNADNVFTGITTTGQLDINGSIDVSSTSVFNNDLTLKGGSYDVLWDSSDNSLDKIIANNLNVSAGVNISHSTIEPKATLQAGLKDVALTLKKDRTSELKLQEFTR